ncbi:pectin lyase fold/virulence factor [Crepidotus variabilis]|uniref:Pectinesterase n=1 Tax=Crepidotus variabilis TaxID=179855 RepID=A0A9P6EID7_9AGAR|nr:pectin lyase fold/virulence factor [Crepidotus variabilis]
MLYRAFCLVLLSVSTLALSPPASRTSPPAGAKIVRAGTSTSGEYSTFAAAVAALPNDSSSQTIFIYPGTYTGQVNIQRSGPVTVLGYSTNPGAYSANQVTLTASVGADTAGSNDASGTLRIHTNSVSIYNVNIRNGRGAGTQAIALSNYGDHVGLYACQLVGYQDTLLTNQGKHVYLQSYIEGTTDFIFGQLSQAYFEGNTIAVSGTGWITASGRASADAGIYLFSQNKVVLASSAPSGTKTYFGRPWRSKNFGLDCCIFETLIFVTDYARVIFKSTTVTAPLQTSLWSIWNTGDERTDHVTYGDYATSGSGVSSSASRPSWAPLLSSSAAAAYTLSSALGGDTAWIDKNYLI